MRIIYLLTGISLSVFVEAFSQGSIAGKVRDAKTGEALIGANVVIQGTNIGGTTNEDGIFEIPSVTEGTYTLKVSYVTYNTYLIPGVVVETAKKITLDIVLKEDVSELKEVVISVGRQMDTDFELIRSIKDSKAVVVGITAEQISKTLDRDAAQVLRRVPGITIRNDQFVQIRGLSERYNPVLLHNTYAPSLETDVRSFSFAMIPSSQLDRLLAFKSPAADLPGDFAGGVVKIFTKSIPEENGFIIDYSTQVRAGTTFSDYSYQQKNPGHFTGFDTKYYELPPGFPQDVSKVRAGDLVNVGQSLKNLWTPVKGTATPDQRLTITFNRKFNIGKMQVGNISAINYSNAYTIFDVQRGDYTESNNVPDQNFSYADKQYNQHVRACFLFNWAFKFSPSSKIELKNLYNQSSADQYVDRTGTGISTGQKNGAFDKYYRGIYSGQLLGAHDLFHNQTSVEWVAGYNNSYRDQPDYKRYRSDIDGGTGLAQIYIPNTVTPNLLGRFYSKLNEGAYSGGLSIKQRFAFTGNPLKSPELKAGVFFENKNRLFNARNIGYTLAGTYLNPILTNATIGELFQPQNINNTTGIEIGEITYKKDSYRASNSLVAYYLMTAIPFGKINLETGVRIENNLQQLHSYDDFAGKPVDVNNQVNRILPSANVNYNFNGKMLVRAAYGETLNRPEFRELAPFSFFDFNFNFLNFGNPNLKTAKIQNFDLRWEYYPSKNELVTLGGFYKNFNDPIEAFVDINSPGGGVKNVSFQNAQYAKSYGVEVEIKKSFSGLTASRFLNNLNVMFNAALIKSIIKIPDALAAGREAERPLQGQAPYVINAGAFYTANKSGWQFNLLYNVVGKNIVFVGNKNYHDVYLMSRNVLDITFSKKLSERFQLKGGITDILNQPLLFLQDGNGDGIFDRKKDQVVQQYSPGQVFSLGFSSRL